MNVSLNKYLLFFLLLPAVISAAPKPNIIVILSDDMGVSDIGCYGGEINTPTLDRLAANGLRFTQFYNTGRCCPTRASLLSGLYPHQAGVGHMMGDRGADGYRGEFSKNAVTIAEALKPAGYSTYMAGSGTSPRMSKARQTLPSVTGLGNAASIAFMERSTVLAAFGILILLLVTIP